MVGYSVYTIGDKLQRGCAVPWTDWAALGLDALSLALPFVPAGGMAIRLAAHADDLGDVLKLVNRPADIVHNAKVVDQALGGGEEVIEAIARGGTYRLLDPLTGEVQYVGHTKNLVRRLVEHRRDPIKGRLEFDVDWRTDDYGIQRGREQMLYDLYHPLLNHIQPISLKNPRIREYLNAARRYGEELMRLR
ncbi:MAG: GIY-YIG nuclease family protein [Bellilinea sp.]|jgi:hypothetical protein